MKYHLTVPHEGELRHISPDCATNASALSQAGLFSGESAGRAGPIRQ
ncbi:MAG TPA: hypothetical protein VGI10_04545 [Polyangiaceae bacterium]